MGRGNLDAPTFFLMRQLSSSLSPRSKWVRVLIIAGGLLLLGAFRVMEDGLSWRLVLEACGVIAFFWLLDMVFSSDLADEVQDCGDHLLVSRGEVTERIPLTNLRSVEVDSDGEVMTLHFAKSTAFGRKVAFSPVASLRLNPFREHPLVEELMNRAHAARL